MRERTGKYSELYGANLDITSPDNRYYSTWIGASLFSVNCSSQECFITKDEYEETGPSAVHRKCF